MGAQHVSNPLEHPDPDRAFAGTRYFVVLNPVFRFDIATASELRLETTLSRDRYDEPRLENEEIGFAQLIVRFEQELAAGDRWSLGAGYSNVQQGEPDPTFWRRMTQDDRFAVIAYRLGFGSNDWIESWLEYRHLDATYTVHDPDYEEDATVVTLGAHARAVFGDYLGMARLSGAEHDATGRFARKTAYDGGLHLARYIGPIWTDLGVNWLAERFAELDPVFGDAKPSQTLRTWSLQLTWPFATWVSATLQATRQDRSSDISAWTYRNETVSLSLTFVN